MSYSFRVKVTDGKPAVDTSEGALYGPIPDGLYQFSGHTAGDYSTMTATKHTGPDMVSMIDLQATATARTV